MIFSPIKIDTFLSKLKVAMLFGWASIILTLIPIEVCFAKVFDFKQKTFATYFRGIVATSQQGQSSFKQSSGTPTSFAPEVNYTLGGEFGLLLNSQVANFRLGVEGISAKKLDGIEGRNVSSALLMNLTSQVVGYIPSVYLEFPFKSSSTSRFLFSVGGGLGYVTLLNDYVLTSLGSTTFPGVVNFTEESKGTGIAANASIGYEFSFVDSVGLFVDLGYKQLMVSNLKHQRQTTSFLGTHQVGDSVKNSDGSDRTVSLSGYFFGLAFRFFL
jgi:hypothetical protein